MNTLVPPKITSMTWAILPSFLSEWSATLSTGTAPSAQEPGKNFYGSDVPDMTVQGGIAYIPIEGILLQRPNAIERGFGAMGYEDIIGMIDDAEADPNVHAVVFCFNSPGGSVAGMQGCAARIAAMTKPACAYCDGMMCSAAYALGSQVNNGIYLSSGAVTGSVGVIAAFVNYGQALKDAGIEANVLTSGAVKAAGHPAKQMEGGERAMLQSLLDAQGQSFRAMVKAKRSGIADSDLEGAVYDSNRAVQKGFADKVVSSLSEAAGKINGGAMSPEMQFRSNHALRAEFGTYAVFAAWKKAERQGRVFISKRGGTDTATSRRPPPKLSPTIAATMTGTDYAAQFLASRELQAEFTTVECYTAFMKAQRGGHIKLKK